MSHHARRLLKAMDTMERDLMLFDYVAQRGAKLGLSFFEARLLLRGAMWEREETVQTMMQENAQQLVEQQRRIAIESRVRQGHMPPRRRK